MRIRPATVADLPRITAIYNHAVTNSTATFDDTPFTVEQRTAWFSRFDDDNPCVVIEPTLAPDIAGFAYYAPYRPKPGYATTQELTVYVDPEAQARGLGTALYRHLIEHARRRNVHVLLGVIAGDNPASDSLHRKLGFRRVGTLQEIGRKFDTWVDTAYWQLIL